MARAKTSWLLAGLLCLALWPAAAHAQSPELLDAYNRFSELYAEGRYEPLSREEEYRELRR